MENEENWEDVEDSDEESKQYCMRSRTGMKFLSKRDVENLLTYAVKIQNFKHTTITRFYKQTNNLKNGKAKLSEEILGRGGSNGYYVGHNFQL